MKLNKATITIVVLVLLTGVSAYIKYRSTQATDTPSILVIAPLTGPGAALGASSRSGMELALEDITNSGVKMDLVFQDSRTDPTTAQRILSSRKLYASSRIVISEMSQVTRALVKPAEEQDVLLLATAVGVPNIGAGSLRFIRINVMSDAIAPPLARYAAKSYKDMAILFLNDDYGRSNHDLFRDTFLSEGGKVVLSEPFSTDADIVPTLVEKVRQSGAQACFVAGYGPAYVALFRAFKELAPKIQLFADIGLANAPVFQAVAENAEGAYLAATDVDEFPPTTERGKELAVRFKEKNPQMRPDYVVAFSYDTVTVLADALSAVPSGDPAAVRSYLINKEFSGMGGRFKFNLETGDSIYQELPVFQVKSGQIVRVRQ